MKFDVPLRTLRLGRVIIPHYCCAEAARRDARDSAEKLPGLAHPPTCAAEANLHDKGATGNVLAGQTTQSMQTIFPSVGRKNKSSWMD